MSDLHISQTITRLFRAKERLKDIPADADFFDCGVSSLTVVELQINIENELKVQVPTSALMGAPSLAEWIDIYNRKVNETADGTAVVV